MADETLQLLAADVRGKTLRIIDGLSEADARWTPAGTSNSILWHAGHALIVVEHLSIASISGQAPQYPKEWYDKFSWASKPATVTEWPTLAEVRGKLAEQLERFNALITGVSDEDMKRIIGQPPRTRSLRHAILHGFHDEANHQGEAYLLKKLLARR